MVIGYFLYRIIIDFLIFYMLEQFWFAFKNKYLVGMRPGESVERYWQRRYVWQFMKKAMANQERRLGGGEETRQWFIQKLEHLPTRIAKKEGREKKQVSEEKESRDEQESCKATRIAPTQSIRQKYRLCKMRIKNWVRRRV